MHGAAGGLSGVDVGPGLGVAAALGMNVGAVGVGRCVGRLQLDGTGEVGQRLVVLSQAVVGHPAAVVGPGAGRGDVAESDQADCRVVAPRVVDPADLEHNRRSVVGPPDFPLKRHAAASAAMSLLVDDIVDAADRHNDPGKFTAFLGWEWSSIPTGANLHRVVISPNGADKGHQYIPFGSDQSQYPEDLWAFLDKTAKQTGSEFIAIPHNSNVSKGYMFPEVTLRGQPITVDYARTRMVWEPVVEMTQIKGDSETHSQLSPNDPFADFENYPFYMQKTPEQYTVSEGDYIRSGLRRGLEIENNIGVNPYKFGLIGSTDSHTGLSSAEEDNFWGKFAHDSTPETKRGTVIIGGTKASGWNMSASGLAAVWAT
ncbi:hypothetical protein LCGC14_2560590, partial [marine sediment metagenome]